MKKLVLSFVIAVLILSQAAYAEGGRIQFKDISEDHWAYAAIQQMVERGVLTGYPDGTFKGQQDVSRGEFSKMMVLALNLPLQNAAQSSFSDIPKHHWVLPYVETAKYYLTGFQSGGVYRFKPDGVAVREDMAVALVKALNYTLRDESDVKIFADWEAISPNLRKYVATAYDRGIMVGSVDAQGHRLLAPQSAITRAEAAVLLMNVVGDEKITFDYPVITSQNQVPVVSGQVLPDGSVKIQWEAIDAEGLQGYKVVASSDNAEPSYPNDGYYAYITDLNTRSVVIKTGSAYQGGGMDYFKAGQSYYFTITALYESEKVTGNVVKLTFGQGEVIPKKAVQLTGISKEGKIYLDWTSVTGSDFNGYKVVASLSDSTPKYPDNGYYKYITDISDSSAVLTKDLSYNSGDFKTFQAGQTYFFSITTLYSDGSSTVSNVVKLTLGQGEVVAKKAVQLTGVSKEGKIYLDWTSATGSDFNGYKVVASLSDSTPKYPDNGYYKYITDISDSSAVLTKDLSYNSGDFKTFQSGKTYYFSITTLYSDGSSTVSNVVKMTMP